ncbi:MAG TPA: patatin-like phospholipase family protein [Gemmatimonadales bacterium]|nr:patatin-like phospholipase family protein [Gemmatimonadales bacterium]
MPNRALVLSGGGSRGAFELGAADYLVNDLGLDFSVIAGVSTGALNAVVLAQGRGLDGLRTQVGVLKDVWFGIRSADDIYRKRFLGEVLVFLLKDSIYSPKPIWAKIQQYVDPERLQGSGRELRIGATILETGAYRTIDQRDPRIREWTLASASMPLFFPPVHIDGAAAVDGGLRNVTPLADAFRALKGLPASGDGRPDELYVLLASPLDLAPAPAPSSWKTGRAVAERGVDVLVNEVFREDLSYALAINRTVRRAGAIAGAGAGAGGQAMPFGPSKYRSVGIKTILPEKEYSQALEFDPRKIREAFAAGRAAATHPLSEDELENALRGTQRRSTDRV